MLFKASGAASRATEFPETSSSGAEKGPDTETTRRVLGGTDALTHFVALFLFTTMSLCVQS